MKRLIALLLLVAFTGCSSMVSMEDPSNKIQKFLNATVPPTFHGDISGAHKNPYFDFTIKATNVRKENGLWVWDSLSYHRSDRFTDGEVVLVPSPKLP